MAAQQQASTPDLRTAIADKTVLKTLGQCSFAQGGEIASVDVKDGKIVRIRPHHHDERYTEEELGQYELEKDGVNYKTPLEGPARALSARLQEAGLLAQPHQVPAEAGGLGSQGAPGSTGPGRNPQNRGKSKYVRISWDEATTIIADEIEAHPQGVRAARHLRPR